MSGSYGCNTILGKISTQSPGNWLMITVFSNAYAGCSKYEYLIYESDNIVSQQILNSNKHRNAKIVVKEFGIFVIKKNASLLGIANIPVVLLGRHVKHYRNLFTK